MIIKNALSKIKKVAFTLTSCIVVFFGQAQDMTNGFQMLEQGNFVEAKSFFSDILGEQPENQTAQLCYARATGLSGNVVEAQNVFKQLLINNPDSEEVLLNLAESYLWDGNGAPAADIYSEIIEKNNTNFTALLGYANSMSMLKKFNEASEYIDRAIAVEPTNLQARVSRKFIRLGLANYLASQKAEFNKALAIVDQNLTDDSEDQNSLTLKATIYLLNESFQKARDIYVNKIENDFDKYIGWSVTTHLLKEDIRALEIVEEGLKKMSATNDSSKIVKMRMQYITALLWNSKLKEAKKYIEEMIKVQPDNKELLATKAQVLIYLSDYEGGLNHYQKFLGFNPGSFSGNLGSADAFHALGMDNKAYEGAFKTLDYFPGQKDVVGFIGRLNAIYVPEVEGELIVSKSSDESWRRKIGQRATLGITPLTKVIAGHNNELFGDATNDQILVSTISAGISHRFSKRMKTDIIIDQSKAKGDTLKRDFTTYQINAAIRVNRNQQVELSHQRELQNFNKDLLTQNIVMNHYIIKNSAFWKLPKIGWYTEVYHTQMSDNNIRNLLFTSLYKNLTDQPLLKSGFNYSSMSFKASKPSEYFSPGTFHSFEWFAGFNVNQSKSFPLRVSGDIAVGYQISDGNKTAAWRAQLTMEKKLGRFEAKAFAMHNSLSAVTNNGFSFSQAGFSLSYKLTSKPIFYNKYALSK